MNRDTAFNILLGTLLILALAVPFAAVFGLMYAICIAVAHLFPAVSHPRDLTTFVLLSSGLLIECVRQLRKHLWNKAFLLAVACFTTILPLFSRAPASLTVQDMWWFVIFLVPDQPSRAEFMGGSAIFAASFALKTGLLGSGVLSIIISVALFMATLAWVVFWLRNDRWDAKPSLLSPARS
jgi:hypothetical protein